jgi:tRNA (adenine22-N1)-methyltransferase
VLAGLALEGLPAADVACDHGLLATALVASGRVPRAVASDLRPEPLAGARRNASRLGVSHLVDVRLGDGLLPLTPQDACATAFIAGVGGATAADILSAVDPRALGIRRLVFQVPQAAHALRRHLREHGVPITQDLPLVERGRHYATIVCDLDAPVDPAPYSELELLLGRHPLRDPSPALFTIAARHAASARARLDGLHRASAPDPDALATAQARLDALDALLARA